MRSKFAKFASVENIDLARLIVATILAVHSSCEVYAQTQPPKNAQSQQEGQQNPNKGSDDVQIKEIKKVSKISLVVLDKNCPDIVQPYKLVDNVASIGAYSIKEGTKAAIGVIAGMFRGKPSKEPGKDELWDSAKLAAKQFNWLPMKAEVAYGAKSHETETNVLERTSKAGEKYYPIADELLKKILSTISEKHEYNFQLFILKNDEHNAVARPGGFLYLDQGLLVSPELLPKAHFALAHEISHVLQRHETKELQSAVVDSMTSKKQLLDVMQKVNKEPAVILDHVKVGKDIFSQHHSDQELQSDSCAVRLLSRVFPERRELANTVNVFLKDLPSPEPTPPRVAPQTDAEKLAALGHDVVNTPLKRHPTTTERTANLQSIYQEILKGGGP